MLRKSLSKIIAVSIMAMCVLLLASACNGVTTLQNPANLGYNGTSITWDETENADHYILHINEGDEIKVSGTSYTYDGAMQNFDVKIKAVSNNTKKFGESGYTMTTFKPLAQVTGMEINGEGLLTWDSVTEATGYRISINNVQAPEVVSVTQYQLPVGTNAVMVRGIVASDASYYSKWNAPLTYTMLSAPKELKFDSENITWAPVDGAANYTLKINGDEFPVSGTSYKYVHSGGAAELVVSVRANGTGEVIPSQFSASKKYGFLEPISSVRFENGVLVWDTIWEGVKNYKIRFTRNGVVRPAITVDTASYSGAELVSGEMLSVEVLAVPSSENYFSVWSPILSIRLLSKPTAVNITRNDSNLVLTWQPETNEGALIDGYDVIISSDNPSDVPVIKSTANLSMQFPDNDPLFQNPAQYTLVVIAKAKIESGFAFADSVASSPVKVRRLAEVSSLASSHDKNGNDGPTISWSAVAGVTTYIYAIKEGTGSFVTTSVGNTLSRKQTMTGGSLNKEYTITVTARGSSTTNSIVLDGNPSQEFVVTKLATPTRPTMSEFNASWSQVALASGYSMSAGGREIQTSSYQSVPMAFSGLAGGNYKLTVRALGNGSTLITSDASEEMDFTKLSKPAALQVSGEGMLTWTGSASSFSLSIGTETRSVLTNSHQMLGSELSLAGLSVNVYAIGNGSTSINSDPSDAITVYKLAAPQNLGFNNDEVSWNSVSNALTYIVEVNQNRLNNSDITGTRFLTSHLNVGANTVAVKASRGTNVSNGTAYYVDSDPATRSINKLAAPTVRIDAVNGKYVWDVVPESSGYRAEINTIIRNIEGAANCELSLRDLNLTQGTYSVKIRANGGSDWVASAYTVISQAVQNIDKPSVNATYNGSVITATATEHTSFATGFEFTVGTKRPVQQSEIFTSETITTAGEYRVSVVALGGVFNGDVLNTSVYYVDSVPSNEINLKILSAPVSLSTSITGGSCVINWNHGTFFSPNYRIVITVNGAQQVNTTVGGTTYTFNGVNQGDSIEVKIINVGDGATTFDSKEATITRYVS